MYIMYLLEFTWGPRYLLSLPWDSKYLWPIPGGSLHVNKNQASSHCMDNWLVASTPLKNIN